MAEDLQKPHAIVIPYPLQGHVIPSVHLAIKLASRGFAVTFLNTESVHHHTARAHPSSSSAAAGDHPFAAAGLDIRYRTVSDGLPVEFDRSLNHDQFMAALLHVFSAHAEAAVAEIVAGGDPPVTCLVADTFFVWPSKIAKKLGLIYVSYWTEPALVFSLYYHLDLLRNNGHFDCHDVREDTIDYIPGISAIEPKDMMSYLQDRDTSSVCHQIIFKAFDDAKSADFVLCNTVQELEPQTILALRSKTPFYAIGPIGLADSRHVATSLWPESDCAQWLDSRPRGSVLYVSFGSYAHISKRDLTEIADGLRLSGASFVWAVRPGIVGPSGGGGGGGGGDPLPVGFRDGVGDRAMVVPWCRQAAVLGHPAVGGFLTHCGWNSVLESVWCEIPLLCFPLLTDQFTNRKLVVSDWKIGISLSNQGLVSSVEVSEKINNLLLHGFEYKKAIREVKLKLDRALSPNGSSVKNMDQFIEDLRTRMRK